MGTGHVGKTQKGKDMERHEPQKKTKCFKKRRRRDKDFQVTI